MEELISDEELKQVFGGKPSMCYSCLHSEPTFKVKNGKMVVICGKLGIKVEEKSECSIADVAFTYIN
jgi:hypothetical protein